MIIKKNKIYAYPELVKSFNKIKNGRRVTIEKIMEGHSKLFKIDPDLKFTERFIARIEQRKLPVVKKDGKFMVKIRAFKPEDQFLVAMSRYSFENRQ